MRALVLDTVDKYSDQTERKISAADWPDERASDMHELLEPIAALDDLLEVRNVSFDPSYPVACCSFTDLPRPCFEGADAEDDGPNPRSSVDYVH